jgi:hypothetical protein
MKAYHIDRFGSVGGIVRVKDPLATDKMPLDASWRG